MAADRGVSATRSIRGARGGALAPTPVRKVLILRRNGMMLMRDAPVAVDLAQSDGQAEQKPASVCGVLRCAGPASHDRQCEGDVVAGGDGELLDVERLRWLVIVEE